MKLLILLIFLSCNTLAHTWDEPWHKSVVADATSLGLYEVLNNNGGELTLKLKKHIAGQETEKELQVSKFYLYGVTSTSTMADRHDFNYEKGQFIYALLNHSNNAYAVATPTAGIDRILDDGGVVATFRHTLHQTHIASELYEMAQRCIFNALHDKSCEQNTIKNIVEPLEQRVAVLSPEASKEDFSLFFKQHVALETAYLIKHPLPLKQLNLFLDSEFFHVQVSAVRALSVAARPTKQKELLEYALNEKKDGIARVMAIIMLDEIKAYDQASELENSLSLLSEQEVYIGANIMDPRIGTWYPMSVKAAAKWFINQAENYKK